MTYYPAVKTNYRLHFFGEDSLLIGSNKQLFFNSAETLFLEKMNGMNSLEEIASKIASELNTDRVEAILKMLKNFMEKISQLNILEILLAPKDTTIITTGMKGHKFPLNILLEITNKCNLKCVHCYKEAGYDKNDEIEIENLFEKLNLLSKHVFELQISGGEPISHRKFPDIIEFVKSKFNSVSITTAATLITERNVNLFKGLDSVQISLYSSNKDEHEKVTLVKGSYEKTLNGIKILSQNGAKVCVSNIVTNFNYNNLESLVTLAIEKGAKEV